MTERLPHTAPRGAGAPEPKIEITPEMIAAGVSAFLEFDSRFADEADAVEEIYRAMAAAKVAAHHRGAI